MWSAFDGNKKRDASVGYDKSASIMRFLNWHNKTPVDVFSFCAKKLIYGGLTAVLCLCYGCVISPFSVSRLCHLKFFLKNYVSWLCHERKIMCHSAPHTEWDGSPSNAF